MMGAYGWLLTSLSPPTGAPLPPAQCRRWLGYHLPVHASVLRCVSVHTCALAIISCVAATMRALLPWWWDWDADDKRCWPHVVLCGGRIACVWDDDDRARHVLALLYDD